MLNVSLPVSYINEPFVLKLRNMYIHLKERDIYPIMNATFFLNIQSSNLWYEGLSWLICPKLFLNAIILGLTEGISSLKLKEN
jgi:hypothetical protein